MTVGSYLGAYLPAIWGGSVFSPMSVLLSAVGGFVGIWAGFKLAQRIGLD